MQTSLASGNQPKLQGRPVDISEIGLNDVLLGRGASLVRFEGNIRFRQLVQERMPQYTSSTRRKVKDEVAREVVAAVKARNGRFLRKLVSYVERSELKVPEGADCWYPVDDTVALEKVKQAFRDNSGKNNDSPAASSSRGIGNPSVETLQLFASNPALGALGGTAAAMDPLLHRIAALNALHAQQADQNRINAALHSLLGGGSAGPLMNPNAAASAAAALNRNESERSASQRRDQNNTSTSNSASQANSEADLIATRLRMQQLQNALGGSALTGMGGVQSNDLLLALARERMLANPASLGLMGQGNRSLLDLDPSLLSRGMAANPALAGLNSSAAGGGSVSERLLQSLSARQLAGGGGQPNVQALLNLRPDLMAVDRAGMMASQSGFHSAAAAAAAAAALPTPTSASATDGAQNVPKNDEAKLESTKAGSKSSAEPTQVGDSDDKKKSPKRPRDSDSGSEKKKMSKNS